MPYLRAMFDNHEIERQDLHRPLVIGRSPECDLAVRDVMLSRRHCRLEAVASDNPAGEWQIIDLDSKNGTSLNGHPLIGSATLCAGDTLRLGRLEIQFHSGSLAEAGLSPLKSVPLRPADPTECLSATFAGYRYLDPGEAVTSIDGPAPRPLPKLPAAYAREDVYSLLNALASSSWDSIYAEARKPLSSTDNAATQTPVYARRPRPRSPIDLSLQAMPDAADVEFGGRRFAKLKLNLPQWGRIVAASAVWIVVLAVLIFRAGFSTPSPAPALAQSPHQTAQIQRAVATLTQPPALKVASTAAPHDLDPNVIIFCQITSAAMPLLP